MYSKRCVRYIRMIPIIDGSDKIKNIPINRTLQEILQHLQNPHPSTREFKTKLTNEEFLIFEALQHHSELNVNQVISILEKKTVFPILKAMFLIKNSDCS